MIYAAIVVMLSIGSDLLFSPSDWYSNPPQAQKPSKSDCIAGVRLEWSEGLSQSEAEKLSQLVYKKAVRLRPPELAALRYHGTGSFYGIFSADCVSKDSLFLEFLKDVSAAVGQDPAFTVINGPIAAGPNTIEVSGPYWKE